MKYFCSSSSPSSLCGRVLSLMALNMTGSPKHSRPNMKLPSHYCTLWIVTFFSVTVVERWGKDCQVTGLSVISLVAFTETLICHSLTVYASLYPLWPDMKQVFFFFESQVCDCNGQLLPLWVKESELWSMTRHSAHVCVLVFHSKII